MVSRIVVGAHYGIKDWLVQRISAVVIAAYGFYVVIRLALLKPDTIMLWKAFFNPFTQYFTMVAMVAICWHAWIGMRDIFMDYVKPLILRLFLQSITIVVLIGYIGWMLKILFSIH